MNNDGKPGALGSNAQLGPMPEDALRQQAFLILSRLQSGTEDVVRLDVALAAVAAERERCAKVCEDEARIRTEAGNTHPEDSDSRGRCFAAARAAINCAKGVRGGEVVGPNVEANRLP